MVLLQTDSPSEICNSSRNSIVLNASIITRGNLRLTTVVKVIHGPINNIYNKKSQRKQNSRNFVKPADAVGQVTRPSSSTSHRVSVFLTALKTAEELVPE